MAAEAIDQRTILNSDCVYDESFQAAVVLCTDSGSTVDGNERDALLEKEAVMVAPVVLCEEGDEVCFTLLSPYGDSEAAENDCPTPADASAAIIISTDEIDSEVDTKVPDESLVSSNPETKESLRNLVGVKSLRVRVLNSAATRYDVSAESSVEPFLKAQYRCATKVCCGGGGSREGSRGGPFSIDISDFRSVTEKTLIRVSCSSTGSAIVESPESEVIGYVMAERIQCSLNFIIRDIHGTSQMVVKGPSLCRSKCDHNMVFQVLMPDESAEIARLTRAAGANEYTLNMPNSMTVELKAALLCVSMLFDRKMFS